MSRRFSFCAGLGTPFARCTRVTDRTEWEHERSQLLGRRISELGRSIAGTRVERLVQRLHDELSQRGVAFRPPVYLSDEWGCPDGTPLIGVPFYLADARLERIEAEQAGAVEGEEEAMRYMRHEAGHAVNYAFRVHERPQVSQAFGDYARPSRDARSATYSAGMHRSILTRTLRRRSPCGSRQASTGVRSMRGGPRWKSCSGWTT